MRPQLLHHICLVASLAKCMPVSLEMPSQKVKSIVRIQSYKSQLQQESQQLHLSGLQDHAMSLAPPSHVYLVFSLVVHLSRLHTVLSLQTLQKVDAGNQTSIAQG